jgi:hypothetical protein
MLGNFATIDGNKALLDGGYYRGGGVYVQDYYMGSSTNSITFTMNPYTTISNNSAGVLPINILESSTWTLNGYGGGVYLEAAKQGYVVFVMESGTSYTLSGCSAIDGNTANRGGGVYVGKNANFHMGNYASIDANRAGVSGDNAYGGGMYIYGDAYVYGSVTMEDKARIIRNIVEGIGALGSSFGAGAAVFGQFIMNGGAVGEASLGNSAFCVSNRSKGGGVYIGSNAQAAFVKVAAAVIAENNAFSTRVPSPQLGSQIYLDTPSSRKRNADVLASPPVGISYSYSYASNPDSASCVTGGGAGFWD